MRHQSTRLRNPVRRILAATAALPVIGLATASPAHAQDDTFDAPAEAAAAWLASEADGPSWSDGDVSSSLDAAIGLMAAGVGGDQVEATLEWLNDPDVLSAYIYPAGDESEDPQLSPGAAGKVMFTVATAGGDPADFGGVKLADELADASVEGIDPGALSWAALGLSRSEAGVTEEVAAALLAAQCDDGGFTFEAPEGGDCSGDPDTTGPAASALQVIGEPAADAHADAVTWLEEHQSESGGFDNGFGENANSTAYAGQALLGAERTEAAELATAFLIGLQFGCGEDAEGAVRATDPEDEEWGESMRVLATAQALIPLSGQHLAELDASEQSDGIPAVECATQAGGDGAPTADDPEQQQDSDSWAPWLIVGAAVLLAAIVAYTLVRVRRGNAEAKADE